MDGEKLRKIILTSIRTKTLITVAIVVAVTMIASAYLELSQSKNDLRQMMEEEAGTLIQAVTRSSTNAVLSYDEIEKLVSERLLTAARYIYYLDSTSALNQNVLHTIAEENDIFRINIFDKNGEKIMGSHNPDKMHGNMPSKYSPHDFIEPVLKGEKDEIIIGLKSARFEQGKRYAVAKRRAFNKGGAIVLNLDAGYILAFRDKIGLDKMLNQISEQKGIVYAKIQNITDSSNLQNDNQGLTEINKDSFLQSAYDSDSVQTRTILFKNNEIFEAVRPIFINGERIGLLRIGITMEGLKSLESRMVRRGVILSVILFIISFIVLSAIFVRQSYSSVSEKYEKIQTYTGNIIENLSDSIITTDKQGIINIFNKNAEKFFGIKSADVTGKNITFLNFQDNGITISSLSNKRPILNVETEYIAAGGHVRKCSISTTFTQGKDSEINSFTAVIKDITELKYMEEQIKQREKMAALGELASGVAHEIRNPLNSMNMIAQRFETEFIPPQKADEFKSLSRLLQSEIKRVNGIILQFLRFAKPPKVNLSLVNIRELLGGTLEIVESECKAKNINIIKCYGDDATIPGDAGLLKQAFLNLLKNSIEAIESNGEIKIIGEIDGGFYKLTISDNGTGISAENLNKIFNLYFTTKPSGTGMGLSLVQQIISQHNGYITVESSEKQGAGFIISLPIKT